MAAFAGFPRRVIQVGFTGLHTAGAHSMRSGIVPKTVQVLCQKGGALRCLKDKESSRSGTTVPRPRAQPECTANQICTIIVQGVVSVAYCLFSRQHVPDSESLAQILLHTKLSRNRTLKQEPDHARQEQL